MQWFAVAVGGALGAVIRFAVSRGFDASVFPWGTLLVNVAGSFLLAFFFRWGLLDRVTPAHHALWTTGVCGALTTYSTFNLEWMRLLESGAPGRAALYFGGTTVLCALAALGAFFVAGRLG